MRHLPFALLVTLALATPAAAADCRTQAGNLLASRNCGFDADVGGWSAAPGATVSHEAAQGHPTKGALRATDPQGSIMVSGGCLPVRPETSYRAAVSIRLGTGVPYFCGFTVWQYSDEACQEGMEPFLAGGLPPRPEWQHAEQSGVSSATTRSVEVRLDCSGEPGVAVLYDNVVFGPG